MENCTYDHKLMSDKVFQFIYECAMRDAILQRAFDCEKKWIYNVEDAKVNLKNYMDSVLGNEFKSREEHDGCFLKTANDICQCINEYTEKPSVVKRDFSFGNAQKLINISVKYLYGLCCHQPDLRRGFEYCHCPVDQIMLNAVWKMFDKKERIAKLGTQETFCMSWGKEGLDKNDRQPKLFVMPERYCKFQWAVQELIGQGNIYPIEFDYLNWKNR